LKVLISILAIIILSLAVTFSLPPYAVQSLVFYSLNKNELNNFDQNFSVSEKLKTESTISGIPKIWKTKYGARAYYVGSEQRFGRAYNIAFIKSGVNLPNCTPVIIYSDDVAINCNIELGNNWVLNYNGIIRHRLSELVKSKI